MDGHPDYASLSADATLKQLSSHRQGLTPLEASKRRERAGPNTLHYTSGQWFSAAVRALVRDTFLWILLVGLLIAWHIGDGHIMLAFGVALLVNVLARLGFLRHSGQFVFHLERLLHAPATVVRGGKRLEIEADELVVGDIVQLAHGMLVPADLRLLESEHLELNEYNLSGEMNGVPKTARTGTNNLALCGSTVAAGSGTGVVIAVGPNTALGSRLDTIEKAVGYTKSPSQQRLRFIRRRIGQLSLLIATALITFALTAHVTRADFWAFAIVLSAALVPSGLTSELALLRHLTKAPIAWVIRCAVSDVGAKLSLVSLSILGQVFYHVPMAITVVQVIAIDLIALLLPITALGGDQVRKFTDRVAVRLLGFGFVSGALTYLNYLFFFERQGISPVHLSSQSLLYFHAATLSFATIVLCRLVNVIMVRSDYHEQFFTSHLWSNRKLLVALACSAFLVLFSIYYPPLQHYFDSQPLSISDWLTAIVTAAIFFGLQLFQRHTRQHTRKAVVTLHRELHAHKA